MLGGWMKYESFGVYSREPTMPEAAYKLAKQNIKEKVP